MIEVECANQGKQQRKASFVDIAVNQSHSEGDHTVSYSLDMDMKTAKMSRCIDKVRERLEEQAVGEGVVQEWRMVACVLDRLFFVLTVTVMITIHVVTLVPHP